MGRNPVKRGEIEYPERAQQIINFSGLTFGSITPTDLDGLIEYHNKAYVLIEMKYRDAEIKYGQKLAIERLVEDTEKAGKKSLAIIADHEVDDPKEQINAAPCIVRQYYRPKKKWHTPEKPVTVLETIKQFLDWAEANT